MIKLNHYDVDIVHFEQNNDACLIDVENYSYVETEILGKYWQLLSQLVTTNGITKTNDFDIQNQSSGLPKVGKLLTITVSFRKNREISKWFFRFFELTVPFMNIHTHC